MEINSQTIVMIFIHNTIIIGLVVSDRQQKKLSKEL